MRKGQSAFVHLRGPGIYLLSEATHHRGLAGPGSLQKALLVMDCGTGLPQCHQPLSSVFVLFCFAVNQVLQDCPHHVINIVIIISDYYCLNVDQAGPEPPLLSQCWNLGVTHHTHQLLLISMDRIHDLIVMVN